jgi:hypothetical protein
VWVLVTGLRAAVRVGGVGGGARVVPGRCRGRGAGGEATGGQPAASQAQHVALQAHQVSDTPAQCRVNEAPRHCLPCNLHRRGPRSTLSSNRTNLYDADTADQIWFASGPVVQVSALG